MGNFCESFCWRFVDLRKDFQGFSWTLMGDACGSLETCHNLADFLAGNLWETIAGILREVLLETCGKLLQEFLLEPCGKFLREVLTEVFAGDLRKVLQGFSWRLVGDACGSLETCHKLADFLAGYLWETAGLFAGDLWKTFARVFVGDLWTCGKIFRVLAGHLWETLAGVWRLATNLRIFWLETCGRLREFLLETFVGFFAGDFLETFARGFDGRFCWKLLQGFSWRLVEDACGGVAGGFVGVFAEDLWETFAGVFAGDLRQICSFCWRLVEDFCGSFAVFCWTLAGFSGRLAGEFLRVFMLESGFSLKNGGLGNNNLGLES